MKSKFVGLLRGLLRRYDDGGAGTIPPSRFPGTQAQPSAPAAQDYQQGSYLRTMARAAAPQSKTQPLFPKPQSAFTPRTAAPATPAVPVASAAGQNFLQLPLASIIAALPADLRAKLTNNPPKTAVVSIPVESILSQLATGSIKMSFGELRASHPELFPNCGAENDAQQFALPLQEILSRINPALLARRTAKKMDLSDVHIPGPFSSQIPVAGATAAQVPPRAAATPPPIQTPLRSSTPLPSQSSLRSAVTPKPPIAIRQVTPPVPKNGPSTSGTLPAPSLPAPAAPATPSANGVNSVPRIQAEESKAADESILVPLAALAEKWPDNIKRELVQANLFGAQAALPASLIEPGMRAGRVIVAWKNLRTMLRPAPAPVSANDNVELELPLKVLTPLFIAGRKAAGKIKPASPPTDEIPDLFFGDVQKPAAEAPALDLNLEPEPEPVIPAPVAPVIPMVPQRTVVPAAPVAPVPAAAPQGKTISVPLSSLLEKWPEALRDEIAKWNLTGTQVALPEEAVSSMLKRGRVKFTWRELRAWIRPAAGDTSPAHDAAELELPLKVIAPLFLGSQAPKRRSLQPVTDDSIPNFFFDIPAVNGDAQVKQTDTTRASKPAAPTPLDTKLTETNYYTWDDSHDAPQVDVSQVKRSVTPGTDFASRYATPKEVVQRAAAAPGVAGAVVALFDGLAIASQLPEELNADTISAFLPQIFSRTSQSTKELRMGELNNLSFTVGNVPWVIFCVSSVYFAAFGTAGGTLPAAALAAMAKQLDRRSK